MVCAASLPATDVVIGDVGQIRIAPLVSSTDSQIAAIPTKNPDVYTTTYNLPPATYNLQPRVTLAKAAALLA
jgi:hypothetical protein